MSAITMGWLPPEAPYCADTSEQERAEEEWFDAQFMEWAESVIHGKDTANGRDAQ